MLVYGKNVASSYLTRNKINKVYLLKGFNDQNILKILNNQNIKINYLTKLELDRIANGNHQGIILDVEPKSNISFDQMVLNNPYSVVILDHIEDPHNLGAIIRTCEAAGIKDIIIPNKRAASADGIVNKTSAGTLNMINLVSVANLREAIAKLKKKNYWVVGTDMDAPNNYNNFDYPEKLVIIIGNEGKGISPLLKRECDFMIKIPMFGEVNSLNASVAAALVLFESIKRR